MITYLLIEIAFYPPKLETNPTSVVNLDAYTHYFIQSWEKWKPYHGHAKLWVMPI